MTEVVSNYQLTTFEHEAAVRHGIRQAFCLEGNGWTRSDDEAAAILTRVFRILGAKRPTWDEGQLDATLARENCRWCHGLIPEENLAGGRQHVFCSIVCARSAYEHRHTEDGKKRDRVSRQAYAMIARSRQSVRNCDQCGTPFQPRSEAIEQRFCSRPCAQRAMTLALPRACIHCEKVFKPRNIERKSYFCSTACAQDHVALKPRNCPTCSKEFRPKTGRAVYCSIACAKTKFPDRICACCAKKFHPRSASAIFCSRACVDADKKARRIATDCKCCGRIYEAKSAISMFCSDRCKDIAAKFRRGEPPARISAPVFDYVFRAAA